MEKETSSIFDELGAPKPPLWKSALFTAWCVIVQLLFLFITVMLLFGWATQEDNSVLRTEFSVLWMFLILALSAVGLFRGRMFGWYAAACLHFMILFGLAHVATQIGSASPFELFTIMIVALFPLSALLLLHHPIIQTHYKIKGNKKWSMHYVIAGAIGLAFYSAVRMSLYYS